MKSEPLSAASKRPDARGDGAGERALHVTEELGFDEPFRDRRGVEGHERLVAARAVVVDGPGHQFLARAGLALNQHGAVHRRHQLERGEETLHHVAAADQAAEAEPVVQPRPKLRVLALEAPLAERGLEDLYQLNELERLDEEVDGAPLERAHRMIDAPEAGRDHAAHVGIARQRLVQHVQTVGVREPDVHHQRVVGKSVEPREGVGCVGGLRGGEAGGLQRIDNHLAGIVFVLDNQHSWPSTVRHVRSPRGQGVCLC